MPAQKRGLEGSVGAGKTTKGNPTADGAGDWKFWVSHRGGPFLIHNVEDCDPAAGGCKNSYANLIEQGFAPCPKCRGGE